MRNLLFLSTMWLGSGCAFVVNYPDVTVTDNHSRKDHTRTKFTHENNWSNQ